MKLAEQKKKYEKKAKERMDTFIAKTDVTELVAQLNEQLDHHKEELDKRAVITALEHASVWMWFEEDDHSGVKHSVQYPYEESHGLEYRGEGRWVVIARWMEATRAYEYEYPYRNRSA